MTGYSWAWRARETDKRICRQDFDPMQRRTGLSRTWISMLDSTPHAAPPLPTRQPRIAELSWSLAGMGRTSIGSWREALTNAGLHELPIVFVWHNDAGDARESRMAQDDVQRFRVKDNRPKRAGNHGRRRRRRGCLPGGERIDTTVPAGSADRRSSSAGAGEAMSGPRRRRAGKMRATTPSSHGNLSYGKGLFSPGMKRKIATAFNRELDAATRFLDR